MNNKIHVVPRKSEWAILKEGSSRVSSTTKTQNEAIDLARKMAKNNHTELIIHGKDGKIRERSSFGNDPYPPKG